MNLSFMILGVVLVWVSIFVDDAETLSRSWWAHLILLTGMAICLVFLSIETYKIGQIDAIEGKFKYEQNIEYTFDSKGDCVKQDTVYVKIK